MRVCAHIHLTVFYLMSYRNVCILCTAILWWRAVYNCIVLMFSHGQNINNIIQRSRDGFLCLFKKKTAWGDRRKQPFSPTLTRFGRIYAIQSMVDAVRYGRFFSVRFPSVPLFWFFFFCILQLLPRHSTQFCYCWSYTLATLRQCFSEIAPIDSCLLLSDWLSNRTL